MWRANGAHVPCASAEPLETSNGRLEAAIEEALGVSGIFVEETRLEDDTDEGGPLASYDGAVTIVIVLTGTLLVDARGGRSTVGPGQLLTLDQSEPYRFPKSMCDVRTIRLRRDLVDSAHHDAIHAQTFPSNQTALLGDLAASVLRHADDLDVRHTRAAAKSVGSILNALLSSKAGTARRQDAGRRRRAIDFIDRNIGRPALSPAMIAREIGVSRSVLYRTFAADGGVAGCIRSRRLRAFRAKLSSGGCAATVAEIAADLGYPSASQASRSFTAAYHVSPSAFRRGLSR